MMSPKTHAATALAFAALALVGCSRAAGGPVTPNEAALAESADRTPSSFDANVYHAIVKSRVIGGFTALNRGDTAPVLELMAPDVKYTFAGHHALGGTRVSRDGVKKWFGRLFRLVPGMFAIRSVTVSGWPWSTTVVTVFDHTVHNPAVPSYVAHGVQVANLEWGRAVRIYTHVDTARLRDTLDAAAAQGVEEAHAPPIEE